MTTRTRVVTGSVAHATSGNVASLHVEVWHVWAENPINWSTIAENHTRYLGVALTDEDGSFRLAIPMDDPRARRALGRDRCDDDRLQIRVFDEESELTVDSATWSVRSQPYSVAVTVSGTPTPSANPVVMGVFHREDRTTIDSKTAKSFARTVTGETQRGTNANTANDGRYQVGWTGSAGDDVFTRVYDGASRIATSGIVYCSSRFTRLDVQLADTQATGPTEWTVVGEILGLLVTAGQEKNVTAEGAVYLAEKTHLDVRQVANWVAAHKLSDAYNTTDLTSEAYYCLLSQRLPPTLPALSSLDEQDIKDALTDAESANVGFIGGDEDQVASDLTSWRRSRMATDTGVDGNFADILDKTSLLSTHWQDFYDEWVLAASATALWTHAKWTSTWGGTGVRDDVRKKLHVAALIQRHARLVQALDDVWTGSWSTPRDLLSIPATGTGSWLELIQDQVDEGAGLVTVGRPPGFGSDNDYASYCFEQLAKAFPTARIREDATSAGGDYADLGTFLTNNADFDLERTRIDDHWPSADKSGFVGTEADARAMLEATQRIYRIAPADGRFTVVKELIDDDVDHAYAVQAMGLRKFVATYGTAFGGDHIAARVFGRAQQQTAAAGTMYSLNGADLVGPVINAIPNVAKAVADGAPTTDVPMYDSMFGSLSQRRVKHCESALSPSAYLLELMGFTQDLSMYSELTSRRPELPTLENSCENTDVVLPTIDLVNEVLENAVAVASGGTASYPVGSTRTAEQLAELPEFRNDDAYTELASAYYPMALPFNRPDAALEVYLTQLGVPKWELLETIPNGGGLVGASQLAASSLGLSKTAWDLLSGTHSGPNDWQYWGFASAGTWLTDLQDVTELQSRSALELETVLDLIEMPLFNPSPTITKTDPVDPTTWTVGAWTAPEALDGMRMVRARAASGWTPEELQAGFDALSATTINVSAAQGLGRLKRLQHATDLGSEELAAWVGAFIPTVQGRDQDAGRRLSLYDRLFQDPALGDTVVSALALNGTRDALATANAYVIGSTSTASFPEQPAITTAILGVLSIGSDDLQLLIDGPLGGGSPQVTLPNLSVLYKHVSLSRATGLDIETLIHLISRSAYDPFDISESMDFLGEAAWWSSSERSWDEVLWLLEHDPGADSRVGVREEDAVETLSGLAADLAAVDTPEEQVRAAIAEATGLTEAIAAVLLTSTTPRLNPSGSTELSAEAEFLAIAGATINQPSDATFAYETLVRLHKLARLILSLDLDDEEVTWWLANFGASPWSLLDPSTVPENSSAPDASFNNWRELVRLFEELDRLPFEDSTSRLDLLQAIGGGGFNQLVQDRTGWTADDWTFLTGPGGFNTSAATWKSFTGWQQMTNAMALVARVGVKAELLSAWVNWVPTQEAVDESRTAAKSRYEDDAWLEVGKGLQDGLRERQRDALVAWLMDDQGVSRPDQLYSKYLLDTQISACGTISRIRFMLNGAQTLIQRTLLGLESAHSPTVDSELRNRWEWMKTYRVWEAAMKVYLWPENWLQPELRCDVTPLFETLQTTLQGGELDETLIEDAYVAYLEGLGEVAKLRPLAIHHHQVSDQDGDIDEVYIFARTHSLPAKYFWRVLKDGADWSPWKALEVGATGDHLVPMVVHRRLYLFWATFVEKSLRPGGEEGDPIPYWEIGLEYSEFWNGQWKAKRASDESLAFLLLGHDDETLCEFPMAVDREDIFLRVPQQDPARIGVYLDAGKYSLVEEGVVKGTDTHSSVESIGVFGLDDCDGLVKVVDESFDTPSGSPAQADVYAQSYQVEYSKPLLLPDADTDLEYEQARVFASATTWRLVTTATALQFDGDATYSLFDDGARVYLVRPTTPDPEPEQDTDEFELGGFVRFPSSPHFNRATTIPVIDTTDDVAWGAVRGRVQVGSSVSFRGTGLGQRVRVGGSAEVSETSGRTSFMRGSSGISAINSNQSLNPLTFANETLELATSSAGRLDSSATQAPTYRFENLYHPYVCTMLAEVRRLGVKGLLFPDTAGANGPLLNRQAASIDAFTTPYGPTDTVELPYPMEDFDFTSMGAYSQYNWELFFHVPWLIASKLRDSRRYADAREWLHAIFDPSDQDGSGAAAWWKVKPLTADADAPIDDAVALLGTKADDSTVAARREELLASIRAWRNNPFDPHAVARLRPSAYQKAIVIAYLDNLIDWADDLFRQYTMETVNEAVQLYIVASELLGDRPEFVEDTTSTPTDFGTLLTTDHSSTFKKLEGEVISGEETEPVVLSTELGPLRTTVAFAVPPNDRLLTYWDTVEDRLYKIRNCLTIDGQFKPLALYDPPIDPGALIAAAAAGSDLSSLSSGATRPYYRFQTLISRCYQLAGTVRALGSALQAALEKRDVEELALLRSEHEQALLGAIRAVKEQAVTEAEMAIEAISGQEALVDKRRAYYEGLIDQGQLPAELAQNLQQVLASVVQGGQAYLAALNAILALAPEGDGGVIAIAPQIKLRFGGQNLSTALSSANQAIGYGVAATSTLAGAAATRAGWKRRRQEWVFQMEAAEQELDNLAFQRQLAEARLEATKKDLEAHDVQIAQAEELEAFYTSKFSAQELYDWSARQLTSLHYQSFQLAWTFAKKAEQAYAYEVADSTEFISGNYYDGLRKGLLAGEALQYDLERLEVAFIDNNARLREVTKTVSLAMVDPVALVTLQQTGTCSFSLPEWLFDLDFPGHYDRRVKGLSVSIPAVTGAFASVNGQLSLTQSRVRTSTSYTTSPYDHDDNRPVTTLGQDTIAFSSGQGETGLFEFSHRDERYLPFEGAGTISDWTLELTGVYEQLDWGSITDVELRIQYTARDAGSSSTLATDARAAATDYVDATTTPPAEHLYLLVSMRDAHPDTWAEFIGGADLEFTIESGHFPHPYQAKTLTITDVELVQVETAVGTSGSLDVTEPGAGSATTVTLNQKSAYNNQLAGNFTTPVVVGTPDNDWKIDQPTTLPSDIENLVLIVKYKAT